jgi:hypothetical protein
MLKETLKIGIVLFLIGNGSFAQWSGSALTGDTYRVGNVGIGTTTPRAILSLGASGSGKKLMVYDNPATNVQAGFGIDMSNTGGRELTVFHPTNDGVNGIISFGKILESTGAYSENMRITGAGNVGIGTTNPGSFKLAVEGKIAARGVKVTNAAFADYVFEPTYNLRTLSNLNSYINEYKHLPGIPSAKEIEKEGGFELGTMNVKLLEKVEELTLYIIEQDKRIQALENKRERQIRKK